MFDLMRAHCTLSDTSRFIHFVDSVINAVVVCTAKTPQLVSPFIIRRKPSDKQFVSHHQEVNMSRLYGRVYAIPTTTKALIVIIFSLIVIVSVSSLLTVPRALAAPIVSDNFNDNSLDTTKWGTTLFSGFTNTSLGLNETSSQLQIGPLLQNPGRNGQICSWLEGSFK